MRIEPLPNLVWRRAVQMCMRPNAAVPIAEVIKRGLQLPAVRHLPTIERLLQRAEEAFLCGRSAKDSLP
jgi:hypothetical protein